MSNWNKLKYQRWLYTYKSYKHTNPISICWTAVEANLANAALLWPLGHLSKDKNKTRSSISLSLTPLNIKNTKQNKKQKRIVTGTSAI